MRPITSARQPPKIALAASRAVRSRLLVGAALLVAAVVLAGAVLGAWDVAALAPAAAHAATSSTSAAWSQAGAGAYGAANAVLAAAAAALRPFSFDSPHGLFTRIKPGFFALYLLIAYLIKAMSTRSSCAETRNT